jgi:hypothetical protein
VGGGFHTNTSLADVEIGDHHRTCRSWSKTSFYCFAPAKKTRGRKRHSPVVRRSRAAAAPQIQLATANDEWVKDISGTPP